MCNAVESIDITGVISITIYLIGSGATHTRFVADTAEVGVVALRSVLPTPTGKSGQGVSKWAA